MRILDVVLSVALIVDVVAHLLFWWAYRRRPHCPALLGGEVEQRPLPPEPPGDGAAIVRALAAADPWVQTEPHLHVCGLCRAACPGELDVPHGETCPARLAQAWVAQHDEEPTR